VAYFAGQLPIKNLSNGLAGGGEQAKHDLPRLSTLLPHEGHGAHLAVRRGIPPVDYPGAPTSG